MTRLAWFYRLISSRPSRGLILALLLPFGILLLLINSGCGTSHSSAPASTVTLVSLAVSPAAGNIAAGATEQLTATATYSNGSTGDLTATVAWSSANAAVATVSTKGLVTGVATGSAAVMAALNGVSATAQVAVAGAAKTLTKVVLSPPSAALAVGASQQFTATATYSDGSTANVTTMASWSSSQSSIATVSASGLATAVSAGTAMVTATLGGVSGSAPITISAASKTPISLAISPSPINTSIGATQQLAVTATYSDGSTAAVTAQVTWTSSNNQIATVSSSGLVTGVAAGSTSIRGTLDGVSATAAVSVVAKTVTAVAVTPNPASVSLGSTQQLTATATYQDQSTANVSSTVTWSPANPNVATVSTAGLLTPAASGSTTVTATLSGVSGTAPVAVTIAAGTGVNLPTWQADVQRQGLNNSEQSLRPLNVNATSFGKLFSYALDGYAYAEPLLISNVTVNNAAHNVLYVATESDSVYAFDADSYGTGQPLWHTSLLQSGETPMLHGPIQPFQGVTSTPAIDPSTNTMYVVSAQTSAAGSSTFRLNALDITTGAQKPGSPMTITASVQGTNSDSVNGVVSLTTSCVQRAALLLANGNVYIGFGGCHSGWLLAYSTQTLAQVGVFNASPNMNGEGPYASAGGIWMGGGGPAVDSNGNVYAVTGNGPWDGQTAFADSVLKFDPQLKNIQDVFTPDDYAYMNCQDADLAAGGLLLLDGGTQALVGGKTGKLYLVNTNPGNSGGEQANDAGVADELFFDQNLAAPYSASCTDPSGTHDSTINSYETFGTGAYFNGSVYLGVTPTAPGIAAGVRQFTYSSGNLMPGTETTPSVQESSYGTTPFLSANGTSDGILWMIDHGTPLQSGTPTAATLRAYDAQNLATQLYNSAMNPADTPGYGIKFTSPIVANGKVYISTGRNPVTTTDPQGEIDVYGLK